jgi:hypothetical protein
MTKPIIRSIRELPPKRELILNAGFQMNLPVWIHLINQRCPICRKQHMSPIARNLCTYSHIHSSDPPLPQHPCIKCPGRIYFQEKELEGHHTYIHLEFNQHKCHLCTFLTDQEDQLIRHQNQHIIRDRYKCSICEFQFRSIKPCKLHCYMDHAVHIRCEICDRGFGSYRELTKHRRTHNDEVLFCPDCNFVAKTSKLLVAHFKQKHPLQPHEVRGMAEPQKMRTIAYWKAPDSTPTPAELRRKRAATMTCEPSKFRKETPLFVAEPPKERDQVTHAASQNLILNPSLDRTNELPTYQSLIEQLPANLTEMQNRTRQTLGNGFGTENPWRDGTVPSYWQNRERSVQLEHQAILSWFNE